MTLNEGIGNLTDTLGSPDATPQGVGNLKVTIEKHRMINVGATSIEKVEEDKRLFVEKSYMQDVKEDVFLKQDKISF